MHTQTILTSQNAYSFKICTEILCIKNESATTLSILATTCSKPHAVRTSRECPVLVTCTSKQHKLVCRHYTKTMMVTTFNCSIKNQPRMSEAGIKAQLQLFLTLFSLFVGFNKIHFSPIHIIFKNTLLLGLKIPETSSLLVFKRI